MKGRTTCIPRIRSISSQNDFRATPIAKGKRVALRRICIGYDKPSALAGAEGFFYRAMAAFVLCNRCRWDRTRHSRMNRWTNWPATISGSKIDDSARPVRRIPITSCRVVIEAPHRHHKHGNLYRVRIALSVPQRELVVDRDQGNQPEHADLHVAIRDGFKALRRQLEDYVRDLRGDVKAHAVSTHGRVTQLFPRRGLNPSIRHIKRHTIVGWVKSLRGPPRLKARGAATHH
jgi:hypothetical protein